MAQQYNADSITSLKGADRVRKRPEVIFGTRDKQGCFHAIFEIIANSIDEAREGHCSRIDILVRDDYSIVIRDNGRGVPMGWNQKEEKYAWQLIFDDMYAGGKMDDSAYGEALGLNGLGAASCQYASEWFKVKSWYGGVCHEMNFKKGVPVGQMTETADPEHATGTEISFRPDLEVFDDIAIEAMTYVDTIRQQAIQIPNLEFYFEAPEVPSGAVISYPQGSKGYLDDMLEKQYFPNGAYVVEDAGVADDEDGREPYNTRFKWAFTFTRESPVVEAYHNGSPLIDGGTTMIGLQVGLSTAIENLAKEAGKLPKTDKLKWSDISDVLAAVLETYGPGTRAHWKNQTKTAITNKGLGNMVANTVFEQFLRWASDNKAMADKVVGEVLLNKKARESAESVKKKVLRKLSQDVDSRSAELPDKFVDCQNRDPSERELYIVEGDSAMGACKLSRDARFQALMPLRGKIMNCLKQDLSHILNSDIIVDLCRILGCGLEVKSKYIKDLPKFDINKLRYRRVIICTDADIDGMQIRCLVLTMIYRLMPTLIKEGRVFIAETPLFEITYKDGEDTAFAYSDEGRDKILAEWEAKGYNMKRVEVARSKGLGENNPEMMAISTMNPETRRLVQVDMPEVTDRVVSIFDALLGNDLEGRKLIIQRYFDAYSEAV